MRSPPHRSNSLLGPPTSPSAAVGTPNADTATITINPARIPTMNAARRGSTDGSSVTIAIFARSTAPPHAIRCPSAESSVALPERGVAEHVHHAVVAEVQVSEGLAELHDPSR